MTDDITYSKRLGLSPLKWDQDCQYERRYLALQHSIAERDAEIVELRKELNRRRNMIAALVAKAGGWVALNYLEQDDAYSLPVDVFGWRGDGLVVIRTAEQKEPVGDEMALALDKIIAEDGGT